MDYAHWYQQLPHAYGAPTHRGVIKSTPEDFVVKERLSFDLSNEGDHCYLYLRKRDLNTDEVARMIARVAQVKRVDLGYAGKKDRRAVTEQWFSVHLPGSREVDWSPLFSDQIELLQQRRHTRKLRIGALSGNSFHLLIREIEGDHTALEARLEKIKKEGVPNYFGAQRFGFDGNNLSKAKEMFLTGVRPRSKNLQGLWISAARSFLFNEILAERIKDRSWNHYLEGEVLLLDGTSSFFRPDASDPAIFDRLAQFDLHPSGALWGEGASPVEDACFELEQNVAERYPTFAEGLGRLRMAQERRALRLPVREMEWSWIDEQTLSLSMTLSSGSYATAVLRELLAS